MGDGINTDQQRLLGFLTTNEKNLDEIRHQIAELDKRLALQEVAMGKLEEIHKQAMIALFTAIGAFVVDILLKVVHFGGLF